MFLLQKRFSCLLAVQLLLIALLFHSLKNGHILLLITYYVFLHVMCAFITNGISMYVHIYMFAAHYRPFFGVVGVLGIVFTVSFLPPSLLFMLCLDTVCYSSFL